MKIPAFPKPSQVRKVKPFMRVFSGGREVLDLTTKAGADEYRRRITVMWKRQGKVCGLQISPQCKARNGRLLINEVQFDHETVRGMGAARRDDRIEVDGNPVSRAVCCWCNSLRGSRPIGDFDELVP